MWFTALWDEGMRPELWAVVIGLTLAGAVWDVRSRRIPNALTIPGLLAGLAWSYAMAGPAGLADAGTASLLLGLPFVLLFAFAGGGAGDAKLMLAVGAWLGVVNGLVALAAVAASGVVMALCFALAAGRLREAAGNVAGAGWAVVLIALGRRRLPVPEASGTPQRMPYGLAIFVGVVLAAGSVLLWRR